MIPSLDTYLHNEIETKLKIILSNRYIIEEILKGIQPNIARNFIRAYVGEAAREIPIVYTMPQEKITQQGAIYIGLREGKETHPSVGNMEGTYDFKQGSLIEDESIIIATPDKDRLFLEVTRPIGELLNVEGLTFSRNDNVEVEGKRIYFNYDSELEGLGPFKVNYMELLGEEQGTQVGFTSTEQYSVLAVSTNMDTVRCLDMIIKSILILMRNNPEELNSHLLQGIQFGQIEEIPVGTDEKPELLYGRETVVSYTVSYSLDNPLLLQTLEKINVSLKAK
jgi:hypothetical protein